jgi:hypothetical protein
MRRTTALMDCVARSILLKFFSIAMSKPLKTEPIYFERSPIVPSSVLSRGSGPHVLAAKQ